MKNKRSWVSYLVLVLVFAVVCFPVYYGIIGSFMGTADINSFPSALWPVHGFELGNYASALSAIPLARQYLNSVIVSLGVTAGQLITSVLAAYALVFLPMKGRNIWFGGILVTMMIPWEAVILPNYMTMYRMGLLDTLIALMLPFLAAGFGVFLLRQAFLGFPKELQEAARIDGCGNFRFLLSILVPIMRPNLAALAIWSFLSAWNMFFWPLLVTNKSANQTIQIGITMLQNAENANPGLVLAGVVLAIIPTLLLVIFGQRFIVKGLTAGAIK